MNGVISPIQALTALKTQSSACLDVRAELEFAKGSIPGFVNRPILHDRERHEVGTCYKQKGQEAAIALGHALVDPTRALRVEEWLDIGKSRPLSPLLVSCWRGGLRSQIASVWIKESEGGRDVLRIEGGYKAMRAELLNAIASTPELLVLTGMTGSGKTELLRSLKLESTIDIEDLAAHRGSSFGRIGQKPQPAQASFENALGLALWQESRRPLVEDESKVIGSLHLPEAFAKRVQTSPLVELIRPLEERVSVIYRDYVLVPLSQGLSRNELESALVASTDNLKRRLGGALSAKISQDIRQAFASQDQVSAHRVWIEKLLKDYYDKSYEHSRARSERPILFQGSYKECREWIGNQYV